MASASLHPGAKAGDGVIHGVAVPTPVDEAPSPNELYPIPAVRSVALRSDDFYRYQDILTAAGLQRACVVTTESLGADPEGWAVAMAELLDNVVPSWWFVSNEMDAGYLTDEQGNRVESHASDRMDPPEYARFWDAVVPQIRGRQVGVPVVTGGFVSGSVDVLRDYERFIREADYTNLHPWNKDAIQAMRLIRDCRSAFGNRTRFIIGEWNRPADQIREYVRMLHQQQIAAAFFFSWHRFDVDALHDSAGRPTALYDAFIAAITTSLLEARMTAIEDRANGADIKDKLGDALTGEIELGGGVKLKAYYNALLLDVPGAGVYALPEGTVAQSFLEH